MAFVRDVHAFTNVTLTIGIHFRRVRQKCWVCGGLMSKKLWRFLHVLSWYDTFRSILCQAVCDVLSIVTAILLGWGCSRLPFHWRRKVPAYHLTEGLMWMYNWPTFGFSLEEGGQPYAVMTYHWHGNTPVGHTTGEEALKEMWPLQQIYVPNELILICVFHC